LTESSCPVSIIYSDDHFLAINKPAGVLSQPNSNSDGDSILKLVHEMGYHIVGGDDPTRRGLIHRLDRDTSGLLLLSLSEIAHQKFQALFKARTVKKTYHFPAYGRLKRMEFTRRDKLGRNPFKHTTRQVDPEGRDAETHFKLIKIGLFNTSLWEAHPKTGRTHQIRVHAEVGGLSILGDPHYGKRLQINRTQDLNLTHTMLHCKKLEFIHPFSEEPLSLECPYPDDFKSCLDTLQLN